MNDNLFKTRFRADPGKRNRRLCGNSIRSRPAAKAGLIPFLYVTAEAVTHKDSAVATEALKRFLLLCISIRLLGVAS
jgi:hypothetical protein